MTVLQLINELMQHPMHKPVRVVMREVYFADEAGETMLNISAAEARDADDVRNEGPYILISG